MEDVKSNEPKEEKMSGVKKAWDIFTTILTLALVVIAIYFGLSVMNQNKTGELFFPFGYRPVVILSGSMEEALETGGVVIVKQTKEVEVNDIIFFIAEDGTLVIHRYIDTDSNGNMITKGDNNPKEDLEPVTIERLQGKVVAKANWMSGPMNLGASIANWFSGLFK